MNTKKKFKVLIVQHHYYPSIGGAQEYVRMFAEGLVKNGHEVTVYTTNSMTGEDVPGISFRWPFFNRPKKRAQLAREETINGVKVKRFDVKLRLYSFNFMPAMFKELGGLGDYDIVNGCGFNLLSTYKACKAAKKNNKPFVLSAIDITIPRSLPVLAKIFKGIYDCTYGKYIVANSQAFTALTKGQVPQYERVGVKANDVTVIESVIDLKKYRQKPRGNFRRKHGLKKEDRLILYVGRLIEHKGVQDVINMMPKILEKHANATFLIAGVDGGYTGELEKLIEKKGLKSSVKMLGALGKEELLDAYADSEIFVLPSNMEGFGIVMLEAMASGTPCVAYDIENVREVILNNKTGFLAKDEKEFREQILELLGDKKKLGSFRKAGLEDVKKYSKETFAKKFEKVYQELD
ncbi:MAG: glycosyltransferase family 4 protein [archaeon]